MIRDVQRVGLCIARHWQLQRFYLLDKILTINIEDGKGPYRVSKPSQLSETASTTFVDFIQTP